VSVRVLTTGRVRPKRAERGLGRYLPGGWSDQTLPVNVFLVSHPAGLCLFDAGLEARAALPGYLPCWHPYLRLARFELDPADEAVSLLREGGIDPARVRWLVLSHLHVDHAGGLASFPEAEVLVSRDEWQRARGLAGRLRGYVPGCLPPELAPTLVDFEGPAVGPFAGSHDLAGDGSLLLVPTGGHTPGHLALLVRTGEGGFLLAGDLARTAAALERAAPEIASYCEQEGISVLCAHDPEAAALLG
jgi:N-acyl homoserine lactone hydrolase